MVTKNHISFHIFFPCIMIKIEIVTKMDTKELIMVELIWALIIVLLMGGMQLTHMIKVISSHPHQR